mmetsp:Transcript_21141/g.27831  ORF Transcript_21141/g.27831 Transcript_21141/m.27831 type:complete len:251 (+) Transcript_21141:54-806(+)|eukprot:CAMPEP_0195294736 /NCGR_PEP_ID=MMETSP0707-20130614/15794_1 /TAXON_ID=33640 /ORGANISM="Asterionellopsis glacialis, Strain CCMP134" /LENGTH=250 /DNA_ID=CAMNT_0040355787 /DNA_START=157 /DNA_END=909 /DNA_ORIENTATION=-
MAKKKKSLSKIYYETAERAGRPPAFNPSYNKRNNQSIPSGRHQHATITSSSRDEIKRCHGQSVPASCKNPGQQPHHQRRREHKQQHTQQPKAYHAESPNKLSNNHRRTSLEATKKKKDSKEWLRTPSQESSKAWLKTASFSTISTFDPKDPQFAIPQSPPQPKHTNSKAWLYVEEKKTCEEYPPETFHKKEETEEKHLSRKHKRRRSKETPRVTKSNNRRQSRNKSEKQVRKKREASGLAGKFFCFRKKQ